MGITATTSSIPNPYVRTQEELDTYLKTRHNKVSPVLLGDGAFEVSGDTGVFAEDQTRVVAYGEAVVRASDRARVTTRDDSMCFLGGRAVGYAHDRSRVFLSSQAEAFAGDDVTVVAKDHTRVCASDDARVLLSDHAHADCSGSSNAQAFGFSFVSAGEQSCVRLNESATAWALEQSVIEATPWSNPLLSSPEATVHQLRQNHLLVPADGPLSPLAWIRYSGATVSSDGHVELFTPARDETEDSLPIGTVLGSEFLDIWTLYPTPLAVLSGFPFIRDAVRVDVPVEHLEPAQSLLSVPFCRASKATVVEHQVI